MILDNVLVYNINLPTGLQGNGLDSHLNKFDEKNLVIIAGFTQNFLEHFLIVSNGKTQQDVAELLKKMEKISYMVGPTGNLSYLASDQIEHILTKINSLKINEINEEKISLIADDGLREQFGGTDAYSTSEALENQLASAAFYLMNMGYSRDDIQERFNEVRQDPTRLEALFNLQQREIYSTPSEIQQGSSASPPSHQETSIDQSQDLNETIARHIRSIHQEITEERAQKVEVIVEQIKAHVRDNMSELQQKVFRQMHPDRLTRALKTLKTTKRKSKRMNLYIEWYTASLLLSKIELKVEHWQVSSAAGHGSAGVYTAGIDFSRYDNIVREFSDGKLTKVVNISKRILQNPTKKAIQKLGQDLIAETGFDEHLYFTD
jgi:gas vesicle protein